jgi:hypothetical protein
MALRNIHAFGNVFDLVVTRAGDKLKMETLRNGSSFSSEIISDGQSAGVSFTGTR